MGAGVSNQPVYLTRSTMLISHSPSNHTPTTQVAQVRRQSAHQGISSQIAMPLQFYPNNVYNNSGYAAQVAGFQIQQSAPSSPPIDSQYNHNNFTINNASAPPTHQVLNQENPPPYTSIYPAIGSR